MWAVVPGGLFVVVASGFRVFEKYHGRLSFPEPGSNAPLLRRPPMRTVAAAASSSLRSGDRPPAIAPNDFDADLARMMEALEAMDSLSLSRRTSKSTSLPPRAPGASKCRLQSLPSVAGIDEMGTTLCLPTPGKLFLRASVPVGEDQQMFDELF
ncbi:hypothetical protein BRADI_3g19596v3 [Brachypodium distachyon]|uniref:Uncharacterized protein n=1 Tax=Brachypodium distachyon TaxID=15368 RepID=A0A0Q3I5P2_BRADI|nr:hypothetical protein BRADI_3g19596v3 [Brachypodium distachyon]